MNETPPQRSYNGPYVLVMPILKCLWVQVFEVLSHICGKTKESNPIITVTALQANSIAFASLLAVKHVEESPSSKCWVEEVISMMPFDKLRHPKIRSLGLTGSLLTACPLTLFFEYPCTAMKSVRIDVAYWCPFEYLNMYFLPITNFYIFLFICLFIYYLWPWVGWEEWPSLYSCIVV